MGNMASFDKPSGYNPMRWDCTKDGCFNQKMRPKIEVFAECFPGKINFGDVDGIVEINSHALMLEWKGHIGVIPTGQRIMYERITKNGFFAVLCIIGNPETMEVKQYQIFWKGKLGPVVVCDLIGLKDKIKNWADYARGARLNGLI